MPRNGPMGRVSTILAAIAASTLLATGLPVGAVAQETLTAGGDDALLAALAHVPDDAIARSDLVSWLDQDALITSRPGAAQPTSGAHLVELLGSDEPAGDLLRAALQGASSGEADILQRLVFAERWPAELGLDITAIDSHLRFGQPPGDGSVLLGRFDPEAIAAAFEQRGYTATPADGHLLLCGAAGCKNGMDMDLANIDAGLLFGAELGRSEPIAVTATDILSSADVATVRAMLEATHGTAPSLAADPSYRAVATAAHPDARLIQATLLPGGMIGLDPTIFASFADSQEAAGELVVALDEAFEEMPPAQVIAFLDAATATEQVVTIALAYADEADAAATAEVLPRRLETLPSLAAREPLADLLAERGVTSVSGRVIPASDGASAVAAIDLRAPLAGPDPDEGTVASSSQVYRLLVQLLLQRDVLWLAPVLPLE